MKSEKTWVENVSDISYNAEDIFDDEISYLEYSKKNSLGNRAIILSFSLSLLSHGQVNRAPRNSVRLRSN